MQFVFMLKRTEKKKKKKNKKKKKKGIIKIKKKVENKVSLWLFVKIQCHKNNGISNFIQMTLRPYHLYELFFFALYFFFFSTPICTQLRVGV
jgi:hypothetical protein